METFRAEEVPLMFNPQQVELFLAGLIFGLIQEDDLTKIQTCVFDGVSIAGKMQEAIGDFMKKDIPDIIKGVEVIGEVL